jgi:hypothetical protein
MPQILLIVTCFFLLFSYLHNRLCTWYICNHVIQYLEDLHSHLHQRLFLMPLVFNKRSWGWGKGSICICGICM